MNRFAVLALVALLSACAENPFNPSPVGDPLIDGLTSIHNATAGLIDSAEDLELAGDLSHDDVVWIRETAPKIDGAVTVALKIANGELQGDPVLQLDIALAALDTAIESAPSEGAARFMIRTRAVVKFYRGAVINAGAS